MKMMMLPLPILTLMKMKIPMTQLLPASHDRIVFGSFESPIVPVSTPSIEPKFDGFSVKIGEISCVFIDSCKNIVDCDDSVFVASEEDDYVKVLESALKNRNSTDFAVSEAPEDFVIDTLPARICGSVYGVATMRSFASWLFVEKQTAPLVSSDINQLPFFELHDESIIEFDPGGEASSPSLFSDTVHSVCGGCLGTEGEQRWLMSVAHTVHTKQTQFLFE
jgi:hypothetical protein